MEFDTLLYKIDMLDIIIYIFVLKFDFFLNIFSFAQEQRIFTAIKHPFATPTNNGSLTATKDLGRINALPLKLETQYSDFGSAPN